MDIEYIDLPEIGTKAAAVAGIESLIHTAIRAPGPLEPVQLRYWLDAYYQARFACEREAQEKRLLQARVLYTPGCKEDRIATAPAEPRNDSEAASGAESISPDECTAAAKLRKAAEEITHSTEGISRVIRQAAKAAGLAVEEEQRADEGAERAASAPPEQATEDGGHEEARIATAPAEPRNDSAEDETKPARQRPVGWTDGFEPVEVKKSGAAEAAAFKREQCERLQRSLRLGVTMQQIVKAANGNITEDQLLGIRECRRVPVAVYRVLQAALDQIDKHGLPKGTRIGSEQ